MGMIFDGRVLAGEIEADLRESGKLLGKSLLILQCDGSNQESRYVQLKREMGERLGVKVRVEVLRDKGELVGMIAGAREDGILVQLPIQGSTLKETEEVLSAIPVKKDIDGLNSRSDFWPAVVSAVEKILEAIPAGSVLAGAGVAVVGAKGFVGRRLVRHLRELGWQVGEFDKGDGLEGLKNYEVVISATGQADLIKPEMVMDGVVAIDLGYPKGEFNPTVVEKASFFTPVPGGVGPVTVVSLFENLALDQ